MTYLTDTTKLRCIYVVLVHVCCIVWTNVALAVCDVTDKLPVAPTTIILNFIVHNLDIGSLKHPCFRKPKPSHSVNHSICIIICDNSSVSINRINIEEIIVSVAVGVYTP